ncbi:MAG: rRNA maturation RNase YbeY [Gammaproteobacteria bacterium]|nr:MAG: rRNA maturation RNase YbeY [Gammaproteobacteria bacterium]
MPELEVQRAVAAADLPADADFRRWAEAALRGRRERAVICLRIVDEEEGRQLNRQWRGRDHATNVLSFPAGEVGEAAPDLLGDLVICAPVVAREAREQGKSPEAHWAHLTVHGCLHLLGFDHQEPEEAEQMETLEREILARLGYPDPYQDPDRV